MGRIAISLSGDGRGHATRVRAIVDHLRVDHAISIYTSGDAFEMLAPAYRGTDVVVNKLECLRFGYDASGRVKAMTTALGAARYLRRFPAVLRRLERTLADESPDLVIGDFEPALPRVAARLGIPHISINHQHFLLAYDLSTLPGWLRFHAIYMGWVVRLYDAPAVARVVSSFYFPPLRRGLRHVTQTGVLLRPSVLAVDPQDGGYLVAYWRRQAPPGALDMLGGIGCEVRVYGLGKRSAVGNLRFFEADEERFVADLASSRALVCTAGNQLVGEAIYLRKPVFAIPEPGNYEQYMNAHFVAQMGVGEWASAKSLSRQRLEAFLECSGEYGCNSPLSQIDGLPRAISVVRRQLSRVGGYSVQQDPVVV